MKKQIIFSTIILFAAATMFSCGNRHTPRTVVLNDLNDSINYALGITNGDGIRQRHMSSVENKDAAVRAFIDALDKAFNSDADADDMFQVGMQIGRSLRQMEQEGLMGEPELVSNTRMIRRGMEAGIHGTSENWSTADAQEFLHMVLLQMQEERMRAQFNFNLDDFFIEEEIIE